MNKLITFLIVILFLLAAKANAQPPGIVSFTPTKAGAGNTITITGTNLTGATAVSFGGMPATSFNVVSANTITAVVPVSTSGDISVTTSSGTAILGGFVFVHAPSIVSFSPSSGAVGTLITISGAELQDLSSLTIGGRSAVVISNTGTSLVGMVMPGTLTGSVSLSTVGGTANGATNFTVTPTEYPSVQQGDKLVGSGNSGASKQGYSIALSADGNTAVVGARDDNGLQGAAWIYTRSGGVWSQQGPKLVGSGNVGAARQGLSVGINADGNTVIIGGIFDNSSTGAAWVFTRTNGVWTQQGSKLVGSGSVGVSRQGYSVALSADGHTAIVGGYSDNSNVGAAWVFTRSNGVWTQQGAKLVGTGNTVNSYQGQAVALSADGNTAIVGGPSDNFGVGACWIYTRSAGLWTQQGSKIIGTGVSLSVSTQGVSVSLSADGNTAMVGGNSDGSYKGAAWIFTRSAGTWSQQGPKLVRPNNIGNAEFGRSVSLSADGNTAIAGSNQENTNEGGLWVFTRNSGTWTLQGSKLVGTGGSSNAYQGHSSYLSADGTTAIVGGYQDNTDIGAAWAFKSTPPPVIISFTPTSSVAGGTVTLTGTSFTGATAVSFGGTPASSFTVVSASTITAVIGTGSSGTVTVTTPRGSGSHSGFSFISSNASLTTLNISSGTLSPAFASGTFNYNASVANSTSSVTLTPVLADATATIMVNGTMVANGSASGSIALTVGNNIITTTVTAQDGASIRTYTVTVTRAPSAVADLSALALSSGILTPAFASGTTMYSASVGNTTSSITLTPTVTDINATVTVNGTTVANGSASGTIALTVGNNIIATTVTAQDGTTIRTYTVTVTRAPSAMADLSALALSSGILTPGFAAGTTVYTASVSNMTSSVTVSPTVSDATATIKVNGIMVANGGSSGSIALAVGKNTITIAVTAEDGTTTRTYTVTVNRALSANADLSALYLSSGTLSPIFAPGILSYTSYVSNATSSVTLTSRLSDPAATLIVNGTTVNNGNSNSSIALDFGANVINVEVLAPDNTTRKVYIVIVNREAPIKAQLSGLILSAGDLSPAFSAANTNYTSIVENSTNLINLTATAADDHTVIKVNGATVENGSKSNDIVLVPGPNTIRIDVIAQNGLTNTYIIVVTRKASPNAELSELLIDTWALFPAFSSNVLLYGATVDNKTNSISIKAVAVDSAATILIDGKTVGTGTVRGTLVLKIGDNLINITVVARDGTTKIYTVIVNRVGAEVNPLPQTIIFPAITSKTYGDPQFSLAASASSGLPVSYSSSDTSVAIITNGTLFIKGAGNAEITASQNGNYQYLAAKPVIQRLEVAKATLTIIAQNKTKISGSETPVLSIIFSGFVNTENSNVLTAQPVISTTATRSSPEGNYPIFVSGASATNYIISYIEGLLIVTPPQLVIMSINNVITPNGDGKNDNFVIKNLNLYPDNNVIMFDRSGREVFRKQNYANDWNGTMNGSFLPEGTYYYIIDLGPGLKRIKGFVSIVK